MGGGVTIAGPGVGPPRPEGIVSAQDGDVRLVSVASAGRVGGLLGPVSALSLEGFDALGDIEIRDDATISTSALSPVFRSLPGATGPPEQLTGPFVNAEGRIDFLGNIRLNPSPPAAGDVFLGTDSGGNRYFIRPRPRPTEGAGDVAIRGRDLLVRDSDVRAFTPGRGYDRSARTVRCHSMPWLMVVSTIWLHEVIWVWMI